MKTLNLDLLDFSLLADALNPEVDSEISTGGSCHGGGNHGCRPPLPTSTNPPLA